MEPTGTTLVLWSPNCALRSPACPPGGIGQPGQASQPLWVCVLDSLSPTVTARGDVVACASEVGGVRGRLPPPAGPERQGPDLRLSRLLLPEVCLPTHC